MKRALDVTVATILLLAMSPILTIVALAIWLISGRPVLYVGKRVGTGGKIFGMCKFRSMATASGVSSADVTASDDPRITSLGRVLRRSKLDELPQLVNVLRGEMSLVGPRPEAPVYVDLYGPEAAEILSVRPGITGPTQLRFMDEEQLLAGGEADRVYRATVLAQKIASDLEYVRSRTLLGDLRLLLASLIRLVRLRR